MTIRVKTATVEVKADESLADGEFTGYASVFGNRDSYGDVVKRGAFAESLAAKYGADGAGVPCYWGHRMDDPDFNIGITKSAVEDDHGLLVHVKLDMESPKGPYVHRLIKEGRVREMSFAYEVTEGAFVEPKDAEPFFEIRAARLFEVSVVPVGANPEAELTGVKAALAMAGSPMGKALDVDKVRQIRDLADQLLADEEPAEEDTPAGEGDPPKNITDALAKLATLNPRKDA